jgi:hypothetical protein
VAGEEAEGVTCLTGLHAGRGTAHFVEQCGLPVLVSDIVALKDDPAFELAAGVTGRQF